MAKIKRRTKRQKEFLQTFLFFIITLLSISGLIAYLWVYTEIDESLVALEIQNSTVNELFDEIKELQSDIEYLQRADIISSRARRDLGMIAAQPETVTVFISSDLAGKVYD